MEIEFSKLENDRQQLNLINNEQERYLFIFFELLYFKYILSFI